MLKQKKTIWKNNNIFNIFNNTTNNNNFWQYYCNQLNVALVSIKDLKDKNITDPKLLNP